MKFVWMRLNETKEVLAAQQRLTPSERLWCPFVFASITCHSLHACRNYSILTWNEKWNGEKSNWDVIRIRLWPSSLPCAIRSTACDLFFVFIVRVCVILSSKINYQIVPKPCCSFQTMMSTYSSATTATGIGWNTSSSENCSSNARRHR